MLRFKNIEEYQLFVAGEADLKFWSNEPDGIVSVHLDVKTVGPAALYVRLPDEGEGKAKRPGKRWLLGVVDGAQSVVFAVGGPVVMIEVDPSGEFWYRRTDVPASADNPNPDETFTRMEKPGLYQDELSIAVHRIDALNRLQMQQRENASSAEIRRLERLLGETNERIAALTPAPQPVIDPPTDTTQQSQTT